MVKKRDKETAARVGRDWDKRWSFDEVLSVVIALLAVDEKHATGISLDKRLAEINRVFLEKIDSMWKNGEWVTHTGVEERHVTLDESKQSRITEVFTNTRKTKISSRVETVKKAVRNQLLRMLDKIAPDSHIPTDRNVDDIREELRKMYYQGPNATDTPDSGDEGDASSQHRGHFDDIQNSLGKDGVRSKHHENNAENTQTCATDQSNN